MNKQNHIPHLKTIRDFYDQLRIGKPQGHDFSIMRIEDQPSTKRLEMPLFRCDFYRLVFIRSKGVEWLMPDSQFQSSDNCIYFAHPGKLESWKSNEKIKGYLVCFTKEFFKSYQLHFGEFPFFDFEFTNLLFLEDDEAQSLAHQQDELLEESQKGLSDSKEMIAALLWRYLISVNRLFAQSENQIPESKRNNISVYQKFQKTLEDIFADLASENSLLHPTVSTIADRLFLNPSYLNSVIKSISGKTASILIQEKTILEAKSYLMHTDLQITEVAYRLGFENVSYFNRLFKKWTSMSPSVFRKSHLI